MKIIENKANNSSINRFSYLIYKGNLDLFQKIQEKLDTIDTGFGSFDERFDRLDEKISDTKSDLRQEFQRINDILGKNEELMKHFSIVRGSSHNTWLFFLFFSLCTTMRTELKVRGLSSSGSFFSLFLPC